MLWLLWSGLALGSESIWIEGEDAVETTFNHHSWYCCSDVRTDLLSPGTPGDSGSQGDWLSHFTNDSSSPTASYSLEVVEGGDYDLWVRASCYRVGMTVSVDGGPAENVDTDNGCRENWNMNWPGIDIRFMGWIRVGNLTLDPGSHTMEWALSNHPNMSGAQVHGGIDVIHVTNADWGPAGAMSPADMPTEPGPQDWFVWAPGDPPNPEESVFDFSDRIDAPAGTHGHLERDGASFVFDDGTPVKMFGVGSRYPGSDALAEQQAKMYRMMGINMVRLHPVQSMLGPLQTDSDGNRVLDPEALDRLDRWFAALKEQGVYSTWSLFFPHVVTEADGIPSDVWSELPSSGSGKSSYGYVMLVDELEASQRLWMETLLNHYNPYTGVSYAEDPALAVVEVHNEDNLLFHHPLNGLSDESHPNLQGRLQAKWMNWVKIRYGTTEAVQAAWGAGANEDDAIDNPEMEVYGAWEMAADNPFNGPDTRARMGDFIRFLSEIQREYYSRRIAEMRAIGFRGIAVTTAWKAGGAAGAAGNLWSDDAGDAIDRHLYTGGGIGGHGIAEGEVSTFTHMTQPGEGMLGAVGMQVEDKPFIVTEWTGLPPVWWKAETAPVFAYYGMGLHGWDGSYHFTASTPWLRGGWPSQNSYVSETPHYMGQFPALARSVHEGHVVESDLAVAMRIPEDLAFGGYDVFTQPTGTSGWDPAGGNDTFVFPPEAAAVGRVATKVGSDVEDPAIVDLSAYIDDTTGRVTSMTGELDWRSSEGFFTVDTASTQAVVGFAAGQTLELGDFTLSVETDFVSLLLTALDGQALSESGRILITAMARDQQTGTEYNDDGSELLEVGGPPLWLEPVQATVTYRTGTVTSVSPLDPYGRLRSDSVEMTNENQFTIDGRYATTHYLVEVDGIDPPPEDTGETGEKTCGCSAGAAPLGSVALLGWMALAGVRRRRRL